VCVYLHVVGQVEGAVMFVDGIEWPGEQQRSVVHVGVGSQRRVHETAVDFLPVVPCVKLSLDNLASSLRLGN